MQTLFSMWPLLPPQPVGRQVCDTNCKGPSGLARFKMIGDYFFRIQLGEIYNTIFFI